MTKHDPSADDENPLGRNWKEHWKARASDVPEDLLRKEKREARKRAHKKSRRIARKKIEDELAE